MQARPDSTYPPVLIRDTSLGAICGLGPAAQWKWTDARTVNMGLSYLDPGKCEVSSDPIDGVGRLVGEYSGRYAPLAQVALSFGQ